MTSYLRKYVTALASAKDYIAQWSSEHVYADEELIVPFPTLAIFNPKKRVWEVNIKAWVYIPFQTRSLTSYLPSLPSFFTKKKDNDEVNDNEKKKETVFNEELQTSANSSNEKIDQEKKEVAAAVDKENHEVKTKDGGSDDDDDDDNGNNNTEDDIYEDALQDELGEPATNPGRLGLFFVGSSVKVATKSIINNVEHLLKPSDESGFIEEHLELPDQEVINMCTTTHQECKDRKFEYKIKISNDTEQAKIENERNLSNDDDYKTFKCTIYVLARHGISVISDIDDTVKISNVLSKRSLLKHTFYSYFKPVENMSELYQKWHEQKCQFHYVSASPWQLYPALRCFLEQYKFPLGTMNLRKFSWNLEFFNPADTYKIETISQIIDSYPLRRYICVGDSGELDPEIYAKLYTKYPQAIARIFIRDICSTPECSSTCAERYKKAFEDVPKERWIVFKDPKEIETDVQKIISV